MNRRSSSHCTPELNPEDVLKADTHTLDELAKQDLNDRLRAKARFRIPPQSKLLGLVHLEHAHQNTPRYKRQVDQLKHQHGNPLRCVWNSRSSALGLRPVHSR